MGQPVAVVLAAGMGTRMRSKLPKVLHKLIGVPMINHVVNTLYEAGINNIIVVVGYRGELVEEVLDKNCRVVFQKEQLGTGHALLQALPALSGYAEGDCLVVCGDTPLLKARTLEQLRDKHRISGARATVLTACLPDPTGYGRIIKGPGGIERIVEEKDASLQEKAVKEINTGTYCFNIDSLVQELGRLTTSNAQGEYYLTDIIKRLVDKKERVETMLLDNPDEAAGINNRVQMAQAEAVLRQDILVRHMLQGVTIINPEHTYVEAGVKIGKDTVLYPGTILEGATSIGEDCVIGPDTRIVDSVIENGVEVKYSYLIKARVAGGCTIGPFSFLRPGSVLAAGVKVGDFVEVKNSYVGEGSKIPHLSYIGDSTLGQEVNIGAGTITCNYDGTAKHHTRIGDGAFIGSNTNLVAPISVGAGAYIGAGSTVTRDVPDGALAVARGRQKTVENWRSRSAKTSGSDKDGED